MNRTAQLFSLLSLAALPCIAAAPALFPNESLDYNINWPSGLSLGEVHWKAQNAGTAADPYWDFTADFQVSVPGYTLADSYRSSAGANYCLEKLTRDIQHGSRKSGDTVTVDKAERTAKRTTSNGGGETEIKVPDCVKDGLGFLFFVRHELVAGRVPPAQTVLMSAPYDVKLTYLGTNTVKVGDRSVEADRVGCSIQGPASKVDVEIFFARDAVRTPVLVKVPLSMGTFSVELTR